MDDPKEDTKAAIQKVRSTLELSIDELRSDVDALVTQSRTGAIRPIVWAEDFPSWLLVLGELRLWAAVVVLTSATHLSLVKSLVEANCLILRAENA
jgi:hypothetical protein